MYKNTRYSKEYRVFVLAEDEGFEPPQTESESGVLPLHKSSIAGTFVIILTFLEKSRSFLKFFIFSDSSIVSQKIGFILPTERVFLPKHDPSNSGTSPAPLRPAA